MLGLLSLRFLNSEMGLVQSYLRERLDSVFSLEFEHVPHSPLEVSCFSCVSLKVG